MYVVLVKYDKQIFNHIYCYGTAVKIKYKTSHFLIKKNRISIFFSFFDIAKILFANYCVYNFI